MSKGNVATYENCSNEAATAFHRGQHRYSANMYLKSFHASPDRWDVNRWQIFHGFTSILQEEYFRASLEQDLVPLEEIVEDKKELRLYRVEAAFTSGVLNWRRGNREEAADFYREAIRLAEKVPKTEKRHKVMATLEPPDGNRALGIGMHAMGDIIPRIAKRCLDNVKSMERSSFSYGPPPTQRLRSDGTPMPAAQRFTQIPVGPLANEDDVLTKEQVDILLKVGGANCDCCGKSRTELNKKFLSKCSRCGKAYYCSRECQSKQWKAGHKDWCRAPGVFKSGDYVRLQGLQSQPQLNGCLVQIVGEDPNSKGRWEVTMQGGTITISVASAKMEQLRPLK